MSGEPMTGGDLPERLRRCYTGAVFDVLRGRGLPRQALPSGITPLDDAHVVAGPVFTVEGSQVAGVSEHDTLLAWTGLLSQAPAGSVVVAQPNDGELAHMGELSAETLKFRGVRGYVVDGGCRDTSYILRAGFPVWCRYRTPADVVGRWMCDSIGEPVTVGEVTVSTGDYALADRDGVVVIPGALVEEVVEETERVLATENLVRKAILEGVDPKEAYLRHGLF